MVISQKEIATDKLGKVDNMTQINHIPKDKVLIKNRILYNGKPLIQNHYHYCSGCGKHLHLHDASIVDKVKSLFTNNRIYIIKG